MLGIFLQGLRAALRDGSPRVPVALRDAQIGAVSFPQRFGSSLNPHYHRHVLALDGVISGDIERGVRFHEATGLETRAVLGLHADGAIDGEAAGPAPPSRSTARNTGEDVGPVSGGSLPRPPRAGSTDRERCTPRPTRPCQGKGGRQR
ncbi:MAG: hypothetical protein EA422_12845 [Gemmatimonadales bacterium]|nr:MAG: hypothetical protein EA422_12845 [Gemmatimonadales bacterium]